MNISLKKTASEIHNRVQNRDNQGRTATLLLSNDGMIVDANEEAARLLGYFPKNSVKHHISRLLPGLAGIDLLEENGERVNPYLRFLSRVGHTFKVIATDGGQLAGELFFSDLTILGQHQILIMIFPIREENK